jgi:hypothetical protein
MAKVTGPARPWSAPVANTSLHFVRPNDQAQGERLICASRSRLSLSDKHHVRGKRRALTAGAGVAQGGKIDTFEESRTGAEQDGRYGDVHLVDQAVAKILLNDVDAATHSHVLASRPPRGRAQTRRPGLLSRSGRSFRLPSPAARVRSGSARTPGRDRQDSRPTSRASSRRTKGHGPRTGPNMFLPRI